MNPPRLALVALLSLASFTAAASPQILVNSQDWKDAYAGMLFGEWQQLQYNVVTSADQGHALLDRLGTDQPIWLIQSTKTPYVADYAGELKRQGFTVDEVIPSDEGRPAALELGRRLNATGFIVLDGAYGYNAISVIPQALRKKRWVLFSDAQPIPDLAAYLKAQHANAVLRYGSVSKPVQDALAPFNPQIIDKGDRFSNNVALIQALDAEKKPDQVIFSDGRFIERTMFASALQETLLLVGQDRVPAVVFSYLKQAQIPYGVLIGADTSDVGRWIKQNTPTQHIFIKFAQTFIKGPGVSQPWVLDQTFLPTVPLGVSIREMNYNTKSHQLEVTYGNQVNTPTYLDAELEAFVGNASVNALHDTPLVLLEPNATKTVGYDFTIPSDAAAGPNSSVAVQVTAHFGEEPGALERQVARRDERVVTVFFEDTCTLSLGNLTYDPARQGFPLGVGNPGASDCYTSPYLTFAQDAGTPNTLTLPVVKVEGKSVQTLFFYTPLKPAEIDALKGSVLHVHLDYGSRQAYLIKTLDEDRLFLVDGAKNATDTPWLLMGAGAAALLALFFISRNKSSGHGGGSWSSRRKWS